MATIPKIAGGSGSVTDFNLTINKKGYLLAKCPDGHLDAQGEAIFADGTRAKGSGHAALHAEGLDPGSAPENQDSGRIRGERAAERPPFLLLLGGLGPVSRDPVALLRRALGPEEGERDPEHQVRQAARQARGGPVQDLAVEQLVDAAGDRERGDAGQLDRGLGAAGVEEAGELAQRGVAAGERLRARRRAPRRSRSGPRRGARRGVSSSSPRPAAIRSAQGAPGFDSKPLAVSPSRLPSSTS